MARTTENTPLANVAQPSRQQIFEAVVQHASRMPRKCQQRDQLLNGTLQPGGCLYRAEDGSNACFIGCLLTDEEAEPMDRQVVTAIRPIYEAKPDLIPDRFHSDETIEFLAELQGIHDQGEALFWKTRLMQFGREHLLDVSVVETAFNRA